MSGGQDRPPSVCVVGVGYWGKNLARNFAELGALAAIVDMNTGAAAAVSSQTGAEVRTLDAVLGDPQIEGVVIATRAESHYAVAEAALAAGKHVFVEKPLVLDEAEGAALISQAENGGRVLMVGHLLRYHPLFRRMLDLARGGDFGALRYVYSDRLSLGKIRTEEDVVMSFAPHDISMVLALAGEEPADVAAQGAAFVTPGIADIGALQLRFPSGLRADIRVSWMHYKKLQQIVAVCDRASIVFEDSEPDWGRKLSVIEHSVDRDDGMVTPRRGEARFIELPYAEPLKEECRHFLDSIANSSPPLTDGREGRAVLRVLQRAGAAMREAARRCA